MDAQTQIEALTMPVAEPALELESEPAPASAAEPEPPPIDERPPIDETPAAPEPETDAEPEPEPERIPLRDLEDGQRVRGVYAVRARELRRKRNGDAWLRLSVGDATGAAEAVCWEEAEALLPA